MTRALESTPSASELVWIADPIVVVTGAPGLHREVEYVPGGGIRHFNAPVIRRGVGVGPRPFNLLENSRAAFLCHAGVREAVPVHCGVANQKSRYAEFHR